MGFASINHLRQGSEPGADLEAETAAAKAADIRYYHNPLHSSAPDPASADKFLEAITAKGSQPAFITVRGGPRGHECGLSRGLWSIIGRSNVPQQKRLRWA